MLIFSLAPERGNWGVLGAALGWLHGFAGQVPGTLRRLAAQEMPAGHEQIGQRAGHEQAMSVLLEAAIADLGEAEHSLDNADRMLDFGPHFRFAAVSRPLDLIDHAAMSVAAIDEILGLWGVLPDHRPLTAVGLIAPHAGFLPLGEFI